MTTYGHENSDGELVVLNGSQLLSVRVRRDQGIFRVVAIATSGTEVDVDTLGSAAEASAVVTRIREALWPVTYTPPQPQPYIFRVPTTPYPTYPTDRWYTTWCGSDTNVKVDQSTVGWGT